MTTNSDYELPNISVDVVPLVADPLTGSLQVVVSKRIYEPFLGEYALPGVLLTPHERLDEAATRALTDKSNIDVTYLRSLVDLGTFDNPDRDPRGATVSIAKIAILNPAVLETLNATTSIAVPVEEIVNAKVTLPFDHATIVHAAVTLFGEKFLSSRTFTNAVLGDTFPTKIVRGILTQINSVSDGDHSYDPSNLTRQLKSTGWVSVTEDDSSAVYNTITPSSVSSSAYSTSRGRPSRVWEFN